VKISMVSEHASPLAALGGVDAGGQNVHVASLSAALAGRGHHVTVYTRRDAEDLPARVRVAPGLEVVHVAAGPPRHVPKDELLPFIGELADGIARDWEKRPPDLVHGHFWMSGLASLNASRQLAVVGQRVPVVQTFHALGSVKRRHQGSADTSPPERRWLEPSVGRAADRVIATCSDEAFELKAMGVAPERISIAPCGVDLTLFSGTGPSSRRRRSHRILSVGRLVPRKGVDVVIRSLPLLRDAGFDDLELVIVGGSGDAAATETDSEAQRLLAGAAALGVRQHVTFRGQVPRAAMPDIFPTADAVVCTPWYEPFGIVPLEAMACGVPVVAAAVGGLRDTVVDQVTGLLVPPRDPVATAVALARLLGDPCLRRRLGRAGQQRARARYSWDGVAAQTESAYQLTLDAGAARRRLNSRGQFQPVEGAAL
jgi:D-inositol-3-phosphate glycosyltransferase